MEIHKMVKDMLRDHKEKIELLQWGITSGIATLVYPEYLMRIRQKQTPVRRIFLPPIRAVQELLDPQGEFMGYLSEHMIDEIEGHLNSSRFKPYASAPEFCPFEQKEILKTIFDLYMIPNVSRRLPETIAKKFRIGDPNQQLMIESRDIDLFDRKAPIDESTFDFLIEEIVLQLLCLLPTMKKEIELPESNLGIFLTEDEVVMIGHDNGICPIYISSHIIENNPHICEKLKFITSTTIEKIDWSEKALVKGEEPIVYKMNTGTFNQVAITRFKGIQGPTEDSPKE